MKSTFFKYILLSITFILITELSKSILKFDELLYNSLAERLTSKQIEGYFELQTKWKWVGYIFVPIYILLKTSIIASVLYIGTFFFSENEIKYHKLWDISIKAEFIFILVPVLKILWFYFIKINYTLEDFQYFYPLSALNITGYKGLELWYIYPFQILNLFEFFYWLLLAYFIGKTTETNMDRGLKIVLSSYGSTLLLWVAVVMFFTLNYS